MSFTDLLPAAYGYNIVSVAVTSITLLAIGGRVGAARERLGVALPNLYADEARAAKDPKAKLFNCYQRGHQNLLETAPYQIALQLLAGLEYPLIAAGLGFASALGSVGFFLGYASGNEKSRYARGGLLNRLSFMGSTLLAAYVGLKLAGHV
eukprot:TRINITY_DN12549_c0_g1_i1.p2 TRINITY_DN12549_c0_g1~~TRINITY_DN12549_c0_g1_i1.p2  ORF type:complete len:166 (-),score=38.79 TRINITY_DN12549_c0_g1_i1:148-600(-)